MECPECGSRMILVVDGTRMTEQELLHLPRAPKNIERILHHHIWCTKYTKE